MGQATGKTDSLLNRCSLEQRLAGHVNNAGRLRNGRTASRQALGTLTKFASTQSTSGFKARGKFRKRASSLEDQRATRLRRWQLQNEACRILPYEKRLCKCGRVAIPGRQFIEGLYIPATKSAGLRNLLSCGSVWLCPVCAAKVTERRRLELATLIVSHVQSQGSAVLETFTMQHQRFDRLAPMVEQFKAARRAHQSGRFAEDLQKDFEIVGSVETFEVTWSPRSGWHPHSHRLTLFKRKAHTIDLVDFEKRERAQWRRVGARFGLEMNEHGYDLQVTYGAIADYIAKWGHSPEPGRTPWGPEAELTKGHLKQSRNEHGLTPFGILAAALAALDEQEREQYSSLYREYAAAFKGKSQVRWSRGLRELYELGPEKSDELLVDESDGNTELVLVEMNADQWAFILGNDARGDLCEELRTGRPGRVLELLAGLGAEVYQEQYTRFAGWRATGPGGAGEIDLVLWCPILNRWRVSMSLDQADSQGVKSFAYDFVDLQMISSPAKLSDISKGGEVWETSTSFVTSGGQVRWFGFS